MRAILVCVDYSDILELTIPYNRHHFDDVMVVTSTTDQRTVSVALHNRCKIYQTDAFYHNGADFNKFRSLEQGLDMYGREGWLCVMDADVLWPKEAKYDYKKGYLYTPFRRMYPHLPTQESELPSEHTWKDYPRHWVQHEFSGFTQIFHASDPILGEAPWHQTNWKHAGGGDSFFQAKWPSHLKIRPNWECLHLGEAGKNWCGRSTVLTDGSMPEKSQERKDALEQYMRNRRATNSFDSEKISH